MSCPRCGGNNVVEDPAAATITCEDCHAIIQQNTIVNDVQFQETAGGASSAIGQFFTNDGPVTGNYSISSRTATLQRFRKELTQVCSTMHLPSTYVDKAQRFYVLCLSRGFSKGRKTVMLAAALLYIVCRHEKAPHLLIDFADALSCDVNSLGAYITTFCHKFGVSHMPVSVDVYLHRFCLAAIDMLRAELEGANQGQAEGQEPVQAAAEGPVGGSPDSAAQVSNGSAGSATFSQHPCTLDELERGGPLCASILSVATKFLARMTYDNVHLGRLPSGIAGAAVFASLQVHGFHVSVVSLATYLYISPITLERRVSELAGLPVFKGLSVRELVTMDSQALLQRSPARPPPSSQNLQILEGRRKKQVAWLRQQLFVAQGRLDKFGLPSRSFTRRPRPPTLRRRRGWLIDASSLQEEYQIPGTDLSHWTRLRAPPVAEEGLHARDPRELAAFGFGEADEYLDSYSHSAPYITGAQLGQAGGARATPLGSPERGAASSTGGDVQQRVSGSARSTPSRTSAIESLLPSPAVPGSDRAPMVTIEEREVQQYICNPELRRARLQLWDLRYKELYDHRETLRRAREMEALHAHEAGSTGALASHLAVAPSLERNRSLTNSARAAVRNVLSSIHESIAAGSLTTERSSANLDQTGLSSNRDAAEASTTQDRETLAETTGPTPVQDGEAHSAALGEEQVYSTESYPDGMQQLGEYSLDEELGPGLDAGLELEFEADEGGASLVALTNEFL